MTQPTIPILTANQIYKHGIGDGEGRLCLLAWSGRCGSYERAMDAEMRRLIDPYPFFWVSIVAFVQTHTEQESADLWNEARRIVLGAPQ